MDIVGPLVKDQSYFWGHEKRQGSEAAKHDNDRPAIHQAVDSHPSLSFDFGVCVGGGFVAVFSTVGGIVVAAMFFLGLGFMVAVGFFLCVVVAVLDC